MIYLFYICFCLLLIIFQTVILPFIPGFRSFYDLLTLFILYLGLFRPLRQSLPVVFVLGFIMDNLSGAPFGLYTTTYFWLFLGVSWMTRFLQVRHSILLPLLVGAGVLIQNLIFLGTIISAGGWPRFQKAVLMTGVVQLLWAITTGPVLLLMFNRIHQQWDQWVPRLVSEPESQSE